MEDVDSKPIEIPEDPRLSPMRNALLGARERIQDRIDSDDRYIGSPNHITDKQHVDALKAKIAELEEGQSEHQLLIQDNKEPS